MVMPQSVIARLMLVIPTVAVGIVTMQTQSWFWLGALVVIALAWGLLAVGSLIHASTRDRRPFSIAFLIASSACLGYGFGPWSDVSVRGALPEDFRGWRSYHAAVLPSTIKFILRLFAESCG